MTASIKIGRNDECPCGSGKKYKYCCEGGIDWERILRNNEDPNRYLSIRGRNLFFATRLAEILQFDSLGGSLKDYKKAFTAQTVQKIYEAVVETWPIDIDITAVLSRCKEDISGLYIGDYDLEYISRGLVRHSIYANKILVVDPFIYPFSVRDEYNPILNPSQHRTQTLKNVNFYFSLLPWILSGVVEIIRTPASFDHKLQWESLKSQEKKYEDIKELRDAAEASAEELKSRHYKDMAFQQLLLGAPNSYLEQIFNDLKQGDSELTFEDFLKYVDDLRARDPEFLEPVGPDNPSQLYMMSSGASYDIAKITSELTGSYMVTDIGVRWKEIELDRAQHDAATTMWSPFAKALQGCNLKYLNNLRLEHALMLRKEGRLERMRRFMHRVWKDACSEEPFEEQNAILLAQELEEEVDHAEQEWKQIDRQLLQLTGAERDCK